ncbi:hypothetical protein KC336_g21569 [Hortaea werneckii]|nr:hypothetical protein KC336_g21569 [Hortaea werneckii]
MPGDAVVQVYVSYPADVKSPVTGQPVDMPVKVLRQFEKLHTVTYKTFKIALSRKDLSYWDVAAQNWVLPTGEFSVSVGWSSRDLPVQETLQVKAVSSST